MGSRYYQLETDPINSLRFRLKELQYLGITVLTKVGNIKQKKMSTILLKSMSLYVTACTKNNGKSNNGRVRSDKSDYGGIRCLEQKLLAIRIIFCVINCRLF